MQVEHMLMHPSELCQPHFAQSPKVFNAVNVVAPIGKFIVAMLYPKMFFMPIVHQPIAGLKTVGVDNCSGVRLTLYKRELAF
jgi:hypothetical protein